MVYSTAPDALGARRGPRTRHRAAPPRDRVERDVRRGELALDPARTATAASTNGRPVVVGGGLDPGVPAGASAASDADARVRAATRGRAPGGAVGAARRGGERVARARAAMCATRRRASPNATRRGACPGRGRRRGVRRSSLSGSSSAMSMDDPRTPAMAATGRGGTARPASDAREPRRGDRAPPRAHAPRGDLRARAGRDYAGCVAAAARPRLRATVDGSSSTRRLVGRRARASGRARRRRKRTRRARREEPACGAVDASPQARWRGDACATARRCARLRGGRALPAADSRPRTFRSPGRRGWRRRNGFSRRRRARERRAHATKERCAFARRQVIRGVVRPVLRSERGRRAGPRPCPRLAAERVAQEPRRGRGFGVSRGIADRDGAVERPRPDSGRRPSTGAPRARARRATVRRRRRRGAARRRAPAGAADAARDATPLQARRRAVDAGTRDAAPPALDADADRDAAPRGRRAPRTAT